MVPSSLPPSAEHLLAHLEVGTRLTPCETINPIKILAASGEVLVHSFAPTQAPREGVQLYAETVQPIRSTFRNSVLCCTNPLRLMGNTLIYGLCSGVTLINGVWWWAIPKTHINLDVHH